MNTLPKMSIPPKYCVLYQVGVGNCQGEEKIEAKEFLLQSIPGLDKGEEVPDKEIIRQLWRLYQSNNDKLAELCLRCLISHYLKSHCHNLAEKYGNKHNFTVNDLLPLVLDSKDSSLNHGNNNSLATRILQTFDLEQGSLFGWVKRLVRTDKELKLFLKESGIEEVTNWSLLKEYTPKRLQRILTKSHDYSEPKIQQFTKLLECYHTIYLIQIQSARKELGKKTAPYIAPDYQQLQQMAGELSTTWKLSADEVLQELENLAQLIREYKKNRRARNIALNESAVASSTNNIELDEEKSQFLTDYRQLLHDCLITAIEEVTEEKFHYLQRKKKKRHQEFIEGLKLFHCQNIPMEQLAELLGLNNHSQVSRLLNLKQFRADIGRRIVVKLLDQVLELAQAYNSPEQLRDLEQFISRSLDEQISTIIQAAEKEASVSKNRVMDSKFSRGICQYLDTRK